MRHQSQNNNSRASVRPSQTTPRTTTAIRFAALCLLMAVASASGRPDEMTGAMYKFPPHTDPMPWLKRNKHHIEALLRWAKRLNKSIIKESWEDKRLRCRYMVRTIHREGPLGVFWNTVKYNDLCNYRDCKIYGESEQRQRYANKLLNDRWLQSDYYSIPGRNEKIFESEKKKLTEKFFVEKNFESEKKSGKSTIAGNQIILQIGQDIEANWKGKGKWYSAVVTDIEAEGKFGVRYKRERSGDKETVTSDNIRALPTGIAPYLTMEESSNIRATPIWYEHYGDSTRVYRYPFTKAPLGLTIQDDRYKKAIATNVRNKGCRKQGILNGCQILSVKSRDGKSPDALTKCSIEEFLQNAYLPITISFLIPEATNGMTMNSSSSSFCQYAYSSSSSCAPTNR